VNWCLDKLVKNFICAAWSMREACIGKVNVVCGRLMLVPPTRCYRRLLAKQLEPSVNAFVWNRRAEWESDWRAWMPTQVKYWKKFKRRCRPGRFPFYAVWGGDCAGVYYKWADVWRVVADNDGYRFCGFYSMDEAYECVNSVPGHVAQ
jgi:hypothetical protein